MLRIVALQSMATRLTCEARCCLASEAEASEAATALRAVRLALGSLAFQARGGLCQSHEVCWCAHLCARVLRLRACWRAEACKAGLQRNRAEEGVLASHRGGRRAGFSLHCAAMYSGKLSPRGGVLCVRVWRAVWGSQLGTRLSEMPAHACVAVECVFECGSLGTLVKWPAQAAWRDQRAILTSRWPPPRRWQGRARRAFLPACVFWWKKLLLLSF